MRATCRSLGQKAEGTCKRELGALDFTGAFDVRWTTDTILSRKAKPSDYVHSISYESQGLLLGPFHLQNPLTMAHQQDIKN